MLCKLERFQILRALKVKEGQLLLLHKIGQVTFDYNARLRILHSRQLQVSVGVQQRRSALVAILHLLTLLKAQPRRVLTAKLGQTRFF